MSTFKRAALLRPAALFLMLCLFGAGCGGGGGDTQTPAAAAVSRNRQFWQSRGISAYQYTLRVNGFLPPEARGPVRITVRNGVAISIQPVPGGGPIDPQSFTSFDTVQKLFDKLHTAAELNAAQQDQQFDPTYGFPSSAYIDYNFQLADEEMGFTVTDFTPTFGGGQDTL